MYLSQTVPSVRHAALALSLIHRNYLDHHSTCGVSQSHSLQSRLTDDVPLLHYNRAIQLLLRQGIGDSTKEIAITLLVCYLFVCFDQLAGNYLQAMKHLRGGVELLRNMDKTILSNNNPYDTKSSETQMLICQVARQIRRLDMQAVVFLVDWTPASFEEPLVSQLSPQDSAFRSLDEAADQLQILVARVMRLFYTEQQMSQMDDTATPSSSLVRDVILEHLETWSYLFENMLQHGGFYKTGSEPYPLIPLLRLQRAIAWILLSSQGPGKELEFDKFLSEFRQCVALAGDAVAAHELYSGSLKPRFTPDIGLVPVLYIIGAKCRHPSVRREVLSILRQRPIREAAWDSIIAARVVERIIEIEETGLEGKIAQNMEQIAVWQRIESMSWHIVSGQAMFDIKYTFCTQEGSYTESLDI